jgi:hypothetical protein
MASTDAEDARSRQNAPSESSTVTGNSSLRAIAYSLDCLIPGLYVWLGPIRLRIDGSSPEENYPGTLHSPVGIAIVLPGYRIYSTYQGSYDPRCLVDPYEIQAH